ncbi:MAG: hypothetical protein ACODAQ_01900 [Phycisphaeraceae bacterium]
MSDSGDSSQAELSAIEPSAPPTVRGAQAGARRPSRWPTVLGIISIVLGALGLLGLIWQMAMPFVMEPFLNSLGPPGTAQTQELAVQRHPLMLASNVFQFVLAAILLAVGVLLIRRRALARRLGLTWAWLDIVAVVLGLTINYVLQQAHWAEQQAAGSATPGMQNFEQVGLIIGSLVGLVFGCALPVFMLIWLSRAKVKAEVVEWD